MPRALLISLRDPNDAMALQERECFAHRASLDVADVDLHAMAEGLPDMARVRRYDAVFFGGSGAYSVLDDVPWIKQGIELCLRVIDARVPTWASCFGFQGVALALGGEVVRDADRTELGATPLDLTEHGRRDPLLGILPHRFFGQEGHHDHVERLPPGVTLLAVGEVSRNQAFRVDGAPFWASQFHPELTCTTTTARLEYYREHYVNAPGDYEAKIALLASGTDTPEMAEVLSRLVRHEF